jgi:mycoredoxin
MQSDVVVYYKPGCRFAARLRVRLKRAQMPYQAVRFGVDPAADEAVRNVNDGDEVSPTVLVGDRYLSNPSIDQIRAALGKIRGGDTHRPKPRAS